MITENLKAKGEIFMDIYHLDGSPEENVVYVEQRHYQNTILRTGRAALVSALTNQIGDDFEFYINRMIFGSDGTADGVPKYVTDDREGLFGLTVLSKPVVSSVDASNSTIAVFTSTIASSEANGIALNEMALQMSNGDLYSMKTFPDLNKTSTMQLVLTWKLFFV
jgi:hypothetical protein